MKAVWLGGKEEGGRRDKLVDAVMGVRRPVFKRQYNPTKLNGTSQYHSITMMMVRPPLPLCRVFTCFSPSFLPLFLIY